MPEAALEQRALRQIGAERQREGTARRRGKPVGPPRLAGIMPPDPDVQAAVGLAREPRRAIADRVIDVTIFAAAA